MYKGFFIPKGRIFIDCIFSFLTLRLIIIICSKRIYNTSKRMVSRLSIHTIVNLRYLRAILHDPEVHGLPGPRGIQARAFSQSRRDRPGRPDTLVSIWGWLKDLSWTSLGRCYDFHCYLVSPLGIQRNKSKV